DTNHAFTCKLERHGAFFGNTAAMFIEGVPYFRIRAIKVIRRALDQDCYATRPVAFVHNFMQLGSRFVGYTCYGPVDVTTRHIGRLSLLDCHSQAGIHAWVSAAAGSNGYLA